MSQEQTEKPTAKKLRDARKKGQIARSRDLGVALATIAATLALGRLGGRLVTGLSERLARDLSHLGTNALRPVVAGDLTTMAVEAGAALALLVGPIGLATMVVGVGVAGLQGGWNVAPEALTLNWSRLSPANGIKRFALLQSGVDTVKSFVYVAAIGWLSYRAVMGFLDGAPAMVWMAPAQVGLTTWQHVEGLLWRVAWALVLLAIADYGLQYYRLMSSLKMTKQEVRDEARSNEGSAEMKGRVRRVQRDMARRRMLADVPRATVVITNPTHYAVALEYRRGEMAAPVVLAKGRDHLAATIRAKAREHGIPLVENRPLAQALYKTAEVGDTIPAPLFAAVAEVLAQLIRLKQVVI